MILFHFCVHLVFSAIVLEIVKPFLHFRVVSKLTRKASSKQTQFFYIHTWALTAKRSPDLPKICSSSPEKSVKAGVSKTIFRLISGVKLSDVNMFHLNFDIFITAFNTVSLGVCIKKSRNIEIYHNWGSYGCRISIGL